MSELALGIGKSTRQSMVSSSHALSGVLIAGDQGPLPVNKEYLIQCNGEAVTGYLRSIRQRLQSPFVTPSSELLLHARELAHVEIMPSSPLPRALNRVQQMAVGELATQETVGTGLLFPQQAAQDDSNERGALSGLTVWLTGLSGAGKTTIARQVYEQLCCRYPIEMLDADVVRTYLCKDLGYSKQDRDENVRRLGFVADFLTRRGIVVLITAIAPYRDGRDAVRRTIGRFLEVYVNAPLTICEQRDVKGLYKRARAGEIRLFTGIDDPYEAPLAPEVECCTDRESIETSVSKVIAAIENML